MTRLLLYPLWQFGQWLGATVGILRLSQSDLPRDFTRYATCQFWQIFIWPYLAVTARYADGRPNIARIAKCTVCGAFFAALAVCAMVVWLLAYCNRHSAICIAGHYRNNPWPAVPDWSQCRNADAGLTRRTNGKTNDAGLTFFPVVRYTDISVSNIEKN
jgi:hypothetical protein